MQRSLIALALAATFPFAAPAAEGLNYNYVEGGYVATNLDNDNGDIDADGFGGNASFALSDNFHIFGGANTQDTDTFELFDGTNRNRVNTDVNQWRVGLGYNLPIAASTDLVARVAYESFEVDDVTVNGQRFDVNEGDDGYSVEVGVRSALTANAKTILVPVEATNLIGTLGGIGELAREALGEHKDGDVTTPIPESKPRSRVTVPHSRNA